MDLCYNKSIIEKEYPYMKWLIASDLHGSAYYTQKLMQAFETEQADRFLLLGDLLYHGPRNDLPRDYAPKEVIAMLNTRKESILCVRGNCDTEVDQMVLAFPVMAEYALLTVENRMIFATHGHHFHTEQLPPLHKGDILLHGHTHVPKCIPCGNGCFYCNPGSVSIPKEGSAHGYMTLTHTVLEWKDLKGEVYHRWDLKDAVPDVL